MDPQMDDEDTFPYNVNGMAPRRSYGQSQHQHQQSSSSSSSSSSVWQFLMSVLDVFTGPNFGVLMAILVIMLLQFKSSLLSFFYNAMEDGWQQTLLECLFGLRDVTRAYYQMACELMRSFRHVGPPPNSTDDTRNLMMRSQNAGGGGTPPPLVVVPLEGDEEGDDQAQTPLPDHNKQNGNPRSHTITHESSASTARSPSPSTSSSSSSVPHAPSVQEEIEPAFLDETDYPPGWLVYHPVLGVVTKKEADHYQHQHQHQHDSRREHQHPAHPSEHQAHTMTPLLAPSIAASG